MASNSPPPRRRITVVELGVVAVIAALFVAIVVPMVVGSDEDTEQARTIAEMQGAVRRYHAQTGSYPTFGATPAPEQTPAEIWVTGGAPTLRSIPPFAGIDFDASALGDDSARLTFSPDFIEEKPRHAGDAANDGTQRWRIDRDGAVTIDLDDRSY